MQKSKRLKWRVVDTLTVAAVIFSTGVSRAEWGLGKTTDKETEKSSGAADFSEIEKIAAEDPTFAPQVFRMAAQSCMRRQKPSEAAAFYQKALETSPSDTGLLRDMAEAQVAAGQDKEALAIWDKIVAGRSDDVGVNVEYAAFLMKVGQGAKGIGIVKGIAAKKPENISLRYWIADAYTRLNQPAEATEELKAMLGSFPNEEKEITRRLALIKPAENADQKPAAPEAAAPGPVKQHKKGWF